ncbi:DUF4113 domain-containing protein [Fibrella forsythiae]|uniref:DUF4113 domain-containing protein n=1 Tax=Fibrella forsythiae TaxID=2817061 RepID=A0ABS3JUY5_9BACT|nr:DUF4113 domain-containing protein [Fibrella forsythiae]
MLLGLVPANHRQVNLFNEGPDDRQIKLARVVEKLNYRYGRDKIRLAGAGYDLTWRHKQQWISKRYTTQWKKILNAK